MQFLEMAGRYAGRALVLSALELLLVLGPLLVLAFAMHAVSIAVAARAVRVLGMRGYLLLFGWLGTSVHELGHALFCLVFRHRIRELRLFTLDPHAATLGSVRHAYDPKSPYQVLGNFFIAIGPIVLGSAAIWGAARLLLPADVLGRLDAIRLVPSGPGSVEGVGAWLESSVHGMLDFLRALLGGEHVAGWRFWAFLYVTFAVGSSVSLSPADLRSARGGFLFLVAALVAFNLATAWIGDFALDAARGTASVLAVVWSAMALSVVLNALAILALSAPLAARERWRRRGR